MADFLRVEERGQRLARVPLAARIGGVYGGHGGRGERVPGRIGVVESSQRPSGRFRRGLRLCYRIGFADVDS